MSYKTQKSNGGTRMAVEGIDTSDYQTAGAFHAVRFLGSAADVAALRLKGIG